MTRRARASPSQHGAVAPQPSGVAGTHRYVEHTGEVELELEGPTEAAVFEQAALALAELVRRPGGGAAESREIVLPPAERSLLLVDWLGELVFLAEVDGFVPDRVTRLDVDASGLHVLVEGRCGTPAHLVKAVTLHGLRFGRDAGGGWQARVVLDV
jgi:SHS2 domain-containing protein